MAVTFNNIVFPVQDLAAGKAVLTALTGVEPYVDQPYYVGFRVGDVEFGLDPHGHRGYGGPVSYWAVDDINDTVKRLADAGAQERQGIKDVGGGRLTAILADADGNVFGVVQR
jgi:predicted enzyme related to lactoylglutathione lyase